MASPIVIVNGVQQQLGPTGTLSVNTIRNLQTTNVDIGAANDLILGARTATITLNQLGNISLTGFTATSLIGALNELKASVNALPADTAPVAVDAGIAVLGLSPQFALEDHKHSVTTGVSVTIGTANSAGTGTALALATHVHAHGAQTDGTLHAVANGTTAGFLSSADFNLIHNVTAFTLDGIINATTKDNDVNIPSANPLIFRDNAGNFDVVSIHRTGTGAGQALNITTTGTDAAILATTNSDTKEVIRWTNAAGTVGMYARPDRMVSVGVNLLAQGAYNAASAGYAATLEGGWTGGAFAGGNVQILSGSSASASMTSTGNASVLSATPPAGGNTATGAVTLKTGNPTGTGSTGSILVYTGTPATGAKGGVSIEASTGTVPIETAGEVRIKADNDVKLQGRGGSITINDASNINLVGLSATSIVGALNELMSEKADKTISIVAGNGLVTGGTLASNVTLDMGTPGTTTTVSTNAVTADSHTHLLETYSGTSRALTDLITVYPDKQIVAGLADATFPAGIGPIITTRGSSDTRVIQLYSPVRGGTSIPDIYLRTSHTTDGGGGWTGFQKLWHAGNDGVGSTLDADLLDGAQLADVGNSVSLQQVLTLGTIDSDVTLTEVQRVILRDGGTAWVNNTPLLHIVRTSAGLGSAFNIDAAGTDEVFFINHTGSSGSSIYITQAHNNPAVHTDVPAGNATGFRARNSAATTQYASITPAGMSCAGGTGFVNGGSNSSGAGYDIVVVGGASSFTGGAGGDVQINGGAPGAGGVPGGVSISAHATPATPVAGYIDMKALNGVRMNRVSGVADDIADLKIVNSTYWMQAHARLGSGSYNPLVAADDSALLFSNGTSGQGALVIAPWATTKSGLRMDGSGLVSFENVNTAAGSAHVSVLHEATAVGTGARGAALYVRNVPSAGTPNYNTDPAVLVDVQDDSNTPGVRVRIRSATTRYADLDPQSLRFTEGGGISVGPAAAGAGYGLSVGAGDANAAGQNGGSLTLYAGGGGAGGVPGGVSISAHAITAAEVAGEITAKATNDIKLYARGSAAIPVNEVGNVDFAVGITSIVQGLNAHESLLGTHESRLDVLDTASIGAGNGLTGGGLINASPALNVGATNASIVVAADGLAVGFDATAPAQLTDSTTGAVGTAVVPAHRDHRHGLPAHLVGATLDARYLLATAATLQAVLTAGTIDNDVTLTSAQRVILRDGGTAFAADTPLLDLVRTSTGLGTALNIAAAGTDDAVRITHSGTTTGSSIYVRHSPSDPAILIDVDSIGETGLRVRDASDNTVYASLEVYSLTFSGGGFVWAEDDAAAAGHDVELRGGSSSFLNGDGGLAIVRGGLATNGGTVGGVKVTTGNSVAGQTVVAGEVSIGAVGDISFWANGGNVVTVNDASNLTLATGMTSIVHGINRAFNDRAVFPDADAVDPSAYQRLKVIEDDTYFLGNSGPYSTTVSGTFAGAGGDVLDATKYPWAPVKCYTGTTSTGYAYMHRALGNTTAVYDTGAGRLCGSWIFEVPVASDGTNTFWAAVGFGYSWGNNSNNWRGAYFIYNHTIGVGGTWRFETDNGSGTKTQTVTTVAGTGRKRFEIFINAAGTEVTAYIGGTLVATHTTNLPPNVGVGFGILKTVGTALREVYCWASCARLELTSPV